MNTWCFGQRLLGDNKTHRNSEGRWVHSASTKTAAISKPWRSGESHAEVAPGHPQADSLSFARVSLLIDRAVNIQRRHWDTSERRSPWGVMHATLAWGIQGQILVAGKPHNAVAALCENQPLKGVRLLTVENGQLIPKQGAGFQGHPGQLLGILAQNGVAASQPIFAEGQFFTVGDLIEYEKRTCRKDIELTFKLMAMSHYLAPDETWQADDGSTWTVEKLLEIEVLGAINDVTCGGTHRLMAIGLAVQKRERDQLPISGVWEVAKTYVQDYQDYSLSLMNPDGSFSTEWFAARAALNDPQRRLQTTGHVLEWLAVTMTDDQLGDPRVRRCAAYLATLMATPQAEEWAVGPRGHALRGLRIYQTRTAGLREHGASD